MASEGRKYRVFLREFEIAYRLRRVPIRSTELKISCSNRESHVCYNGLSTNSVFLSAVGLRSRDVPRFIRRRKRVGMHQGVLFPQSKHGLNPDEYTIADHLKASGYATACFGKWHLGHQAEVLPRAQGFDTYFGIPYSNDMNYPDNKSKTKLTMDQLWADPDSTLTAWNTPLVENEKIIEVPVDERLVTRRYTDKAIDFVTSHKDEPFFIYLPHSMPHIPLYVPKDSYDPDPKNAYTCVIEHIDAEVGRLVQTVRDLGPV